MGEWQWTNKRRHAAQYVADGKSTIEIAKMLDLTQATIANWKKTPEFTERVDQIKIEMAEALKRAGLRVKENRLNSLNEDFERTNKVIEGRAISHADIPGGDSGLLVRKRGQWG